MDNTIRPQWTTKTNEGGFQRSYQVAVPSQSGTVLTVGVGHNNVVDVLVGDSQFQIRNGELFAANIEQKGATPSLNPWDESQFSLIKGLPQELGYLLSGVPDEPTRQALEPLITQFNAIQQTSRPETVASAQKIATLPDPPFPIPPEGQVYAVPLGIHKLESEDQQIGWTKVMNKATGQYEPAKVYRGEILDDDGKQDGYNFKICLDRGGKDTDRVIGFMQINKHEPGDEAIHVSLMGNIDPRYSRIGQALEAIKVRHMVEVGAKRSEMQTSWKAVLSHAAFNPNATFVPPKFLPAHQIEEAIAEAVKRGDNEMNLEKYGLESGALGSILMHLPEETVKNMKDEKKILKNLQGIDSATENERVTIGTASLPIINEDGEPIGKGKVTITVRKAAGLDIIEIFPKGEDEPIAVMSLNYYNVKDGGMVDSHGIFHETGQPFTRYGVDSDRPDAFEGVNRPHAFIEYVDSAPGKFDEDAISGLQTRVAFEISLHKGFGGRLKFEADTERPWCEEVPSHKDGAKVTDNGVISANDPRRDPEIFDPFVKDAVQRRDLQSLCQWGSFEIIGQKEDEIQAHNRLARKVGEPEIVSA